MLCVQSCSMAFGFCRKQDRVQQLGVLEVVRPVRDVEDGEGKGEGDTRYHVDALAPVAEPGGETEREPRERERENLL